MPESDVRAVGPLVFLQGRLTAHDQRDPSSSGLAPGGRLVRWGPSQPERGVAVLTEGFAAIGRPDVSFDGNRVLFTGFRAPGETPGVWEVNADGTGLRRVTDPAMPVTVGGAAVYLSTIYTLDADEPVHQIAFSGRVDADDAGSLFTCRLDGTRLRRITFNPYGADYPCPLSDGRLLYSHQTAGGGALLMTVNTDGTDVFLFSDGSGRGGNRAMTGPARNGPRGDETGAARRIMACQTPEDEIVYVETESPRGDGGGALAAVSRARSLHTRRVVAEATDGLYCSPAPLGDGRLLVSYLPDGGVKADRPTRRSAATYGLWTLDPKTGARVASVFDDPDWHDVYASRIAPRMQPDGRSSVVKDAKDTGWLYCLNAYLSDPDTAGDGSTSARADRIQPGQIRKLRVLEAASSMPAPRTPDAAGLAERLLGEVPVEADGSFYLEVPARRPLRLETLDESGRVLRAMRNWIWVMPNEARGCIGCHEDRELSPPNRHVQALHQAPTPVGVAADVPAATQPGGP